MVLIELVGQTRLDLLQSQWVSLFDPEQLASRKCLVIRLLGFCDPIGLRPPVFIRVIERRHEQTANVARGFLAVFGRYVEIQVKIQYGLKHLLQPSSRPGGREGFQVLSEPKFVMASGPCELSFSEENLFLARVFFLSTAHEAERDRDQNCRFHTPDMGLAHPEACYNTPQSAADVAVQVLNVVTVAARGRKGVCVLRR